MKQFAGIAAAFSLLAAQGCATFEPAPCSAEWIELRVTQAIAPLARESRSEINALRRSVDRLKDDDMSIAAATAILRIAQVLPELADRFERVSAPRLADIAQTCDDPDLLTSAFIDFLEDEGVDREVLETLTAFRDLIEGFRTRTDQPRVM